MSKLLILGLLLPLIHTTLFATPKRDPRESLFILSQNYELLNINLITQNDLESNPLKKKIFLPIITFFNCRYQKKCIPLPETDPQNLHFNTVINPNQKKYYIEQIKHSFPDYLRYNRL